MESMFNSNVDKLFAFSYDPLKQMLVMIVQNLQEHKEILDKIRQTPRYDFEDQLQEGEDTAA